MSDKKSLTILVQESDLYDWNPSARFLLLILVLGTRRSTVNEDGTKKWVQEDCPYTPEEMVGWCDMAQWRLAGRVGKSESQVHKDLKMFEADEVITTRPWTDSNNVKHEMYQVNAAVVMKRQRPEQSKNMKRPSRYKEGSRKANKGSFSKTNQPKPATPEDFKAEAAGD
jgi:hypothetical protein